MLVRALALALSLAAAPLLRWAHLEIHRLILPDTA